MPKLKQLFNVALSTADKLFERRQLLARPLRIHLEINDLCNLDCIMCARRSPEIPKNRGELSMAAVEKLAPWFKYASYIGLAGNGEPFLHTQLFDILQLIVENGSLPSIVTNGTFLTPPVIERLMRVGPLILVVSIDGATKATFEHIRHGSDFNQILTGLEYLKNLKEQRKSTHPLVNFQVCLMRENVAELPGIIKLAAQMGVPLVVAQAMFPYNPEMASSVLNDPEEIAEPINEASQRARELHLRFEYIPLGSGISQRADQGKNHSDRLYCEYIWQQLHVDVTGEVRYCCFWTEGETQNVLHNPPEVIWNSPGFQALRRNIRKGLYPNSCKDCYMLCYHNPLKIISGTFKEIKDLISR